MLQKKSNDYEEWKYIKSGSYCEKMKVSYLWKSVECGRELLLQLYKGMKNYFEVVQ